MRSIISSALIALFSLVVHSSHVLAATITVDVITDGTGGAGDCELRDAIAAANGDSEVDGCPAGSGDDLISFDPGVPGVLLEAPLPNITTNLEISGPGPDELIIDGDDSHPIFFVTPSASTFTLRGVQLFQGESSSPGGCVRASGQASILIEDVRVDTCHTTGTSGGGMSLISPVKGATFTLRRVFVSGNSTDFVFGGGLGVQVDFAFIYDSTFVGNRANANLAVGGAIALGGDTNLTISRSTFWGNEAFADGSAIFTVLASQVVTIEHSTFSNNRITGSNGGSEGGAIFNQGTTTLTNTVVAGNLEDSTIFNHPDIYNQAGATLISGGHNLIGSNEGSSGTFPAGNQPNGDQVGTVGAPLDPQLGGLLDNGGATLTSMPDPGSPLVDQGSCPGETEDQRGYNNFDTGLRPVLAGASRTPDGNGDNCDIGAVERLATSPDVFARDGFEQP